MSIRDPEPPLPPELWDALRRDEPDPRAIERAYHRFTSRARSPHVLDLGLSRWLVAGIVLGCGVVFAANGTALFGGGSGSQPISTFRSVPSASSAAEPARRKHPAAPVMPTTTAAPSAAVPTKSSVTASPVAAASETRPPVLGTGSAAASAPVTQGQAAIAARWQRVTRALREQDHAAARAALTELETTAEPAERDAASLSLAEISIASGRAADARVRLERLSVSASSLLVREKANRLLAQVRSLDGRSSDAGSDTQ